MMQEVAKDVVHLCRQHPLLIAMAGSALKATGATEVQWRRFILHFEAHMSRRPPADVYRHHLQAALDMCLDTLTADARSLFMSFGGQPSSNVVLVRSASKCSGNTWSALYIAGLPDDMPCWCAANSRQGGPSMGLVGKRIREC